MLRQSLGFVVLAACSHGWVAPPSTTPVAKHDPDPQPQKQYYKPHHPLASLTPIVVAGAVLGQSYDELLRGRPSIKQDPENYDFRDHYVESVNIDGVTDVHYYTMKNRGVMYQISFDFDDKAPSDAAEKMFAPYAALGTAIEDLGGNEVILSGYPFEIRVWQGERRVQFMAIIEGTEWWDQYHPNDPGDPDPDPGDLDDTP